jgi:KaiC/GvpD/RAD55 family RecA-like ATPase
MTGNPVIEGILVGDLPVNSSTALIGAAGTGTSTMAIQYTINALRKGKKVFFVLYDYGRELADKYFKSLGFDAEPFITSGKLQIIDGYELFRTSMGIFTVTDIEKLRPLTFEELSGAFQSGLMSKIPNDEAESSSIVVDSFTSLSPFIDIHTIYEVLADGFARIRTGKHSTLIVAHEGVLEGNFIQALTRFVDGVVRLKIEWSSRGFARELFIEKLRFTNVETPSMDFTISHKGIRLLPASSQSRRGVSRGFADSKTSESEYPPSSKIERIPTGMPDLDTALAGGFPRGTFVCIEGDVGTGTSTFCTQFAWSRLLAGGKVSYYCVDEPPDTVINQFQSFGWDISSYIQRKDIILSDAYNVFRAGRKAALKGAKEPDTTRKLISEFIRAEDAKMSASPAEGMPLVAVIDSFTTLAPYLDLKTAYVLARLVADNARMSDETYLTVVRSGTVEANLCYACLGAADGILTLEKAWAKGKPSSSSERRLVRKMRIEKMVFTPIPPNALEYEITPKGIRLTNSE